MATRTTRRLPTGGWHTRTHHPIGTALFVLFLVALIKQIVIEDPFDGAIVIAGCVVLAILAVVARVKYGRP